MSKSRTNAVLLATLLAMSCSPRPRLAPGAPSPPPVSAAAAPLVEEGASLEASVLVPAADERSGIEWENRWIFDHYGRFRKKSVALASQNGRHYDVIRVELADHIEKVLYFDITEFFGK